jgi:lipopolysaccharide transport system permease protein
MSCLMSSAQEEIIIEKSNAWFRLDFREFWAYRDLLLLLVRRDFVAQYRQTILGPLWSIVQPLMTTLVFTVVFNRFAKVPTDGSPAILFYLLGLTVWNFFHRNLMTASSTLQVNSRVFGKIYFPRLVMPVASGIGSLIPFTIQFAMFLVFMGVAIAKGAIAAPDPAMVLLAPVYLLFATCSSLGAGLLMAALTAKYRDLAHALTFIAQFWMYVTPVIYPVSIVSKPFRWVYLLNPMTVPVEGFRWIFLEGIQPSLISHGVSLAISVLLLIVGLSVFDRVQRSYVDTV